MIRGADGKLAITPGEWRYQRDHGIVLSFVGTDLFHVTGLNLTRHCRANGNLIAEAGTVTNATGRTPAELAALVRELRAGIKAVRDLINESHGVTGLHLNGDVATWQELEEGGYSEEWLIDFNRAEKALTKSEGV
jgi:hypothetical protein